MSKKRRDEFLIKYPEDTVVHDDIKSAFIDAVRFGFWFHAGETDTMPKDMAEAAWEGWLDERL